MLPPRRGGAAEWWPRNSSATARQLAPRRGLGTSLKTTCIDPCGHGRPAGWVGLCGGSINSMERRHGVFHTRLVIITAEMSMCIRARSYTDSTVAQSSSHTQIGVALKRPSCGDGSVALESERASTLERSSSAFGSGGEFVERNLGCGQLMTTGWKGGRDRSPAYRTKRADAPCPDPPQVEAMAGPGPALVGL